MSIKDTIETIVQAYVEVTGNTKTVTWDESKPNGDLLRCLSATKQQKYGILPRTPLIEGIKKTIVSYKNKYYNYE